MFKHIFSACIAASICQNVAAETPENIQNHKIQKRFFEKPCTETVAVIDKDIDPNIGLQAAVRQITDHSMTWGHLLGFESANPGIRGEHETILTRLRFECAQNPGKTAMELLNGFAAEQ